MIQHLGDIVLTCDGCGKTATTVDALSYGDSRYADLLPNGWYELIRSKELEPILESIQLIHTHYCSVTCLRAGLVRDEHDEIA